MFPEALHSADRRNPYLMHHGDNIGVPSTAFKRLEKSHPRRYLGKEPVGNSDRRGS